MNMEERIKRINELYHKSQKGPLSEEEKQEQTRLRKEYVLSIRGSLRAQLNNIDIKENDGSITNLGERFGKKEQSVGSDSSGEEASRKKSIIRKQILESRKLMKNSEVIDKSKTICEKIAELDEYKNSKTVLMYYSYNNEVETFMLLKKALEDGKIVAFPKAELVDGQPNLDFYIIDSLDCFKSGYKGIMEPDIYGCELKKFEGCADVCLVPGVAYTKSGKRIGYGKGFYDRYLKNNDHKTLIGMSYELQLVDDFCGEDTDVSMDMVVTEKNIYR